MVVSALKWSTEGMALPPVLHKNPYLSLIPPSEDFVETHSFRNVLSKSRKTLLGLLVTTKLMHHEITWHYGILFSVVKNLKLIETLSVTSGRISRRWIAMKSNLTYRNCLYRLLFMNGIPELNFHADDATRHPLEIYLNCWCIHSASNSWNLISFEINDSKTEKAARSDKKHSM